MVIETENRFIITRRRFNANEADKWSADEVTLRRWIAEGLIDPLDVIYDKERKVSEYAKYAFVEEVFPVKKSYLSPPITHRIPEKETESVTLNLKKDWVMFKSANAKSKIGILVVYVAYIFMFYSVGYCLWHYWGNILNFISNFGDVLFNPISLEQQRLQVVFLIIFGIVGIVLLLVIYFGFIFLSEKFKFLNYFLSVIKNIILLILYLLILEKMHGPFETIVVVSLMLIYIKVMPIISVLLLAFLEKSLKDERSFINLEKLLSIKNKEIDSSNYELSSNDSNDLNEQTEKMKNVQVHFYITQVFNSFLYMVSLYYIFSAVV